MNIVHKARKQIRWVGLPDASSETTLKASAEEQAALRRISEKRATLRTLLSQLHSVSALVYRNRLLSQLPEPLT